MWMRSTIVVFVLTVAAPAAAQPAREARDASRAARCFADVAAGRRLPPAPPPRTPAERELERMERALIHASDAQGAEAETARRLSACLPRSIRFEPRAERGQARWLASCFDGAARALRGARDPAALEAARFERDACVEVGRAFAMWELGPVAVLAHGTPAHQGVSIRDADRMRLSRGADRLLEVIEGAAGTLARCRQVHGVGTVRAVVRTGSGSAEVRAWPLDAAPDALARCVEDGLRSLAPADSAIAVDVIFTAPEPAESARDAGER